MRIEVRGVIECRLAKDALLIYIEFMELMRGLVLLPPNVPREKIWIMAYTVSGTVG